MFQSIGEGKTKVFFRRLSLDDDVIIIVGGGHKSHVGCVVICEPGKKTRNVNLPGHYDNKILQPLAIAACKKYKRKITVLGGIHIDNASKEDIETVIDNCRKLEDYL